MLLLLHLFLFVDRVRRSGDRRVPVGSYHNSTATTTTAFANVVRRVVEGHRRQASTSLQARLERHLTDIVQRPVSVVANRTVFDIRRNDLTLLIQLQLTLVAPADAAATPDRPYQLLVIPSYHRTTNRYRIVAYATPRPSATTLATNSTASGRRPNPPELLHHR